MAANPDISKLAAYAGDYQKTLFTRLYNGFDAVNDVTLVPNVKNKLNMHKLTIKNGPKPGTGVFKGRADDIGYEPRVLTVDDFQRDIVIQPSKYRTTFMANMRGSGENANNKTIPWAQFTWETIMAEMAASINDRAIYFGVGKDTFVTYNPATAYTAGALVKIVISDEVNYYKAKVNAAAGESPATNPAKWQDFNTEAITIGFESRIKDMITLGGGNGGIDPVTTGVINSTSGAYAQFTKLWRSQSDAFKNRGGIIYSSYTDYEYLTDDVEDKVSKFTETDNNITYLAKTNRKCIIKPVTWMSSSRRLICTSKSNILIGTDLLSDFNNIATEEHPYTLDAGITGVLGTQFQDPDLLKVSDQS